MTKTHAKIAVLPPDVANKIAAGEVVERPASVIKELVENALDAGARRVAIEVEAGGRRLLRVSDDGVGMNRADAERAVQRHATSKIRTARDIDAITTLGFRGEALPSIAAVSHFELLTCERESGQATKVQIDGGEPPRVSDAARAHGTTITVRNLFYCVPARAKFLKTTATELSHIGRFVHSIALAWPRVGMKYIVDNNMHFDLPPQEDDADFLDALRTRLIQLRGDELVDDLIPVDHTYEKYSVIGYVSAMSRSVLTRQELHFFVNRRPVRCPWLGPLLKRAYGSLLATDRYPYGFLFLALPPDSVDVNIHPAKREVRFGKEFAVQSAVSTAVMNALHEGSAAPAITLSAGATASPAQGHDAGKAIRAQSAPRAPWTTRLTVEEWKRLYGREPSGSETRDDGTPLPVAEAMAKREVAAAGDTAATRPGDESMPCDIVHAVGQIGDAYVVAEISGVRNGIVLVDQHAAHERINFDAVLAAMESEQAPQQALLMPVTAHLSGEQAAIIGDRLPELRDAGFGIESFGADTFKIDAVPGYLAITALDSLLGDVANDFLETGKSSRVEQVRQRLALSLVCRGSVKFNQSLSLEEMQALVDQLLATSTPWTCPHGRPTMIVLPFDELEKRFGRRG